MNSFDILFYNVFTFFKPKYKQKSINIAVVYIAVLQTALVLLLGTFFAKFFNQMNMTTMSSDKAWAVFVLISIFLLFKNWMQYTGKRRMMINAKMTKKVHTSYSIWLLMFLPICIFVLTLILFKAF